MRRNVTFRVPGVEGQRRPRARKQGRAVSVYKPAADRKREAAILAAYEAASAEVYGTVVSAPEGTPVRVAITTWRDVRSDFRKRDGDRHPDTSTPDADNIAKSVLDALNGAAWADDAQVDELHVCKCERERGAEATTLVRIEWEG